MPPMIFQSLIYPRNNSKVSLSDIAFTWTTIPKAQVYLCALYILRERRGFGPMQDVTYESAINPRDRGIGNPFQHMVWTRVATFYQKSAAGEPVQKTQTMKLTPGRKYAFITAAFLMEEKPASDMLPAQIPISPFSSVTKLGVLPSPAPIGACHSCFGTKPAVNRLDQYLQRPGRKDTSMVLPLFYHTLERYLLYRSNPGAASWSKYETDFFAAMDRRGPEFKNNDSIGRVLENWRSVRDRDKYFTSPFNLDTPAGVEEAIKNFLREPGLIHDYFAGVMANPLKYSLEFPDLNVNIPIRPLTPVTTFTFTPPAKHLEAVQKSARFYIKLTAGNETRIIHCEKVSMDSAQKAATIQFPASELANITCAPYDAELGWIKPDVTPHPGFPAPGHFHDTPFGHGAGFGWNLEEYVPICEKIGTLIITGLPPFIVGCEPMEIHAGSSTIYDFKVKVANTTDGFGIVRTLEPPQHDPALSTQAPTVFLADERTFEYSVFRVSFGKSDPGLSELAFQSAGGAKSLNVKYIVANPVKFKVSLEEIVCDDESDPEWWGDDTIFWMYSAVTQQLIIPPQQSRKYEDMHDGAKIEAAELTDEERHLYPGLLSPEPGRLVEGFLQIDFSLMEYDDLGFLADILNFLIDAFQNFIIGLIEAGLNFLCPPAGTVCGYLIRGVLEVSGFNDWREEQINSIVSGWGVELLGEAKQSFTYSKLSDLASGGNFPMVVSGSDSQYTFQLQVQAVP
jgi:hypothetical protein